jgi:molybdenum cofactor cytidylyltransferase
MPWRGKPLVRHAAELIDSMEFSQFVVVLGSDSDSTGSLLNDLKCELVINTEWAKGQGRSTSIGVKQLQPIIDAAIFFVADQPKISRNLIDSIMMAGKTHHEEIIVPYCQGKRRNPVLFKRSTFADLAELDAEQGGRSIFPGHSLFEMEWLSHEEFTDVDTLDDYQAIMSQDEEYT